MGRNGEKEHCVLKSCPCGDPPRQLSTRGIVEREEGERGEQGNRAAVGFRGKGPYTQFRPSPLGSPPAHSPRSVMSWLFPGWTEGRLSAPPSLLQHLREARLPSLSRPLLAPAHSVSTFIAVMILFAASVSREVYHCALEEVPLFMGLQDFCQTFPLYRGRTEDSDDGENDEAVAVGQFKVKPLNLNFPL
ncbi:hypothetical protein NDU88_005035 [Pleurodeles waltl]|uniref:Uncharacterized protein n=1 Tax=Pleurodeles waltl TaxID=8319 RepID=A0AAV7LJW8_PLEWA|nr:hypothetical protein NDU88_005035 [Pleurodeles waltl]